jgi:hypothetical protein
MVSHTGKIGLILGLLLAPSVVSAAAAPAKPGSVTVTPMGKGAGNDALVVKMVSVADVNNVWCVANNGTKDAVYQQGVNGLEYRIDGSFVAAGKEIVMVIAADQTVSELPGGTGSAWKKVDGLKLTRVSRPTVEIGMGVLDNGNGNTTLFQYDAASGSWGTVNSVAGAAAQGIIDVAVNAENVAVAITNQGVPLVSSADRTELLAMAQAMAVQAKAQKSVAKQAAASAVPGKKKGKKKKVVAA